MHFSLKSQFEEIKTFCIKLTWLSNLFSIKKFFNVWIFRIIFNISFKVVSVHLFLFCKTSEEISVVFSPSFSFTIKHSLFTSFMIIWITKFATIKFFYFVENTIKLLYGLLNSKPSFIKVTTIRCFKFNSLLSHLTVNSTEGFMHSIKLFMCFLESFKFISWIN